MTYLTFETNGKISGNTWCVYGRPRELTLVAKSGVAWKTFRAICSVIFKDFVIAGDMNADKPYVKSWDNVSLREDVRFTWLIEDGTTTNVANSKAYDR